MREDRDPNAEVQPAPELRNPVPEDMPTDPPLVPQPFAEELADEL